MYRVDNRPPSEPPSMSRDQVREKHLVDFQTPHLALDMLTDLSYRVQIILHFHYVAKADDAGLLAVNLAGKSSGKMGDAKKKKKTWGGLV
jgi:hypothetical protein